MRAFHKPAKAAAEVVLSLLTPLWRRVMCIRGRVAVLAYHNIVPAPVKGGDASLHLPVEHFEQQLDWLMRTHEVVAIGDILVAGRTDKPLAVITFDDAYHGALTHGAAALAARDLPATVFVCPGLLGQPGFWWDLLSGPSGLATEARRHSLEDDRGEQARVLRGHDHAPMEADLRPGSVNDLEFAVRTCGITLANHTWSHPNLTRLPAFEVADQLTRAEAWLAERFADQHLPGVLSVPYGLWTPELVALARTLGYGVVFRVEGGVAEVGSTGIQPRINVPSGMSPRGLVLRASGLPMP